MDILHQQYILHVVYPWYNYTYTYTCGNIIKNNDEGIHFFRKIYLSHFILERVAKRLMLVMRERWVGDGNRLPHIDPKFLCIIAALLLHSAGLLNRVPEDPSPLSGAGSLKYFEIRYIWNIFIIYIECTVGVAYPLIMLSGSDNILQTNGYTTPTVHFTCCISMIQLYVYIYMRKHNKK